MQVGDSVYVIHDRKPARGHVVAMKNDNVIIDIGAEDFRYVQSKDAFEDRQSACVSEATRQRKYARDSRKAAHERLEEAERCESNAVELLAEANAILRRMIQ